MKSYFELYGDAAVKRLELLITDAKIENVLAPVTVIVPSTYAGLSLRHNLSTKHGLINVRFMVLPRLAEFIGSPTLIAKAKTHISPLIQLAAIQNIAVNSKASGPLKEVASHPKLHLALKQAFEQIGQLPKTSLDQLSKVDELRSQLVAWYRTYESLLAGFYDSQTLYLEALLTLKGNPSKSLFQELGFHHSNNPINIKFHH